MPGILECGRDTIIGAHFHRAVVCARAIQAKEQALDERGVIAIDGIVHLFIYHFPLWHFTGIEGFGIGIMCVFACTHCWRCGDQCLYKKRQPSFVTLPILFWKLRKSNQPAADGAGSAECEDGMSVTVAVGSDHPHSPYELSGLCTALQQFASGSKNGVTVTSNGSINKCRNIGTHSN